ncbi:otogelin-like protein isoform X6 [Aquila chrysaetos chrysaetos]|uniref:otogelin-like protein isoform X6 n=1 Tax=Aquila chrysaetos chrysaetos TaxID=223781 RepID=UPI00117721EE|nr:otogelin-like protein isoform X6 [Aquila chrysaetos chrysaetos]
MNIVGKLNLMIPWSIFLLHSLLSSLQGSYCKLSLLRRNSRNEFNATRQKRDLVTAEIQAASPRLHLHGALTRSPPGGSCPQECLNGAVCTEAGDCDCELFQAQGSRCQIVPNTGKDRDGICKSWGQYHFETFDGIYYYFPGNCSYIFAKDCSSPEPQYTVWVHNSPHCYGSVYTCQRSVSLFFSNQEEIIISGHEVRKDGIKLMLPQTVGNAFFERLADYILVKTTFGFSLAWDGSSGIYIKLAEDHKGKPCGLCGNFNGNKYDELILQNIGEYTEDIAEFANSWAVQTSDDIACVPTASDFSSPCPADAEFTEDVFFKCQIFLQFPFLSCHESIDPYSYISSCMNDLCRVDDDETYCRAVTEYARACSHAGSPVRDWRDDFPACTEKCEDSFVHRDCISCCPPTCTFEKDCLGSNLHCLDGCYCPDGLIMENGTCISVSNCPCIYHGTAFPVGSKIEQECSNCICIGGIWNCTDHDCPAECSITGSSHFTTFDGRHFTFLGICQYILVKGTGKNKFTITLQKAPCGQNFDHACIESITLVLEDDVSKQLTLTRYGQVQTGPNQVFNLNGAIEIQNISSFFVQLKTSFGLKILFAKDGERIYVQVDVGWKRRTLGLCGTYNGNLRDDFLSPAGMIEGTPQLHANAWKVSSACSVPINIPVVDPCNVNQQNAGYASHCDIINQEVFAPCHAYISPGLYYQLCRFDACKCGSSCLCNALAHYAYVCSKHGVIVDFRSHISYCAVMCHSGMLYHQCSSFCKHSCASLSMANICGDDCAEGCNCPDGKYFEESVNFCVSISACHCHYKGKALQPGEILPTPTGSCQCLNGTVKCIEATTENTVHICPEGKIYYDCRSPVPGLPAAGVNCGISCANLAMNFSCVPSPPCASGCICPPGMAEHRGKCYIPDSCPCTWKDREFLSGEVIATPCYTCVCRRGIFNCTSYPCPAVCTIYGDRHYYTFDGLEYDYVSDCQAYLLKSTDNSNISIIAQNKKCFDNDIVCSKNVFITVGDTEIYFSEPSEKQKTLRGQENKSNYQLWKAGYYTVIHFPEQDITILWDKKTMIHVKVGPRWKGKLAGLCGNFDKYTSNDLTTSNNMEVRNAQVFGDSWVLGQCKSPNETLRPCEVHQSKFPYAKKECSILYSDVFAPCRNVIDVTSFVKNCHTDTCNCNLGGDCECLCTSIAAYAHKCCQQGAAIHWRSPSLCAYDCEYYNQGLGEGPYILASYGENDTIIGANVSSRRIFPLPRTGAHGNVFFSFMITPGLFKDKDLSLSLVSLESAERPNYFLYVHDNETVGLEQWQASASFRRRATFFHHQGLWSPGLSAFELHSKKGFFIILTSSGVKVAKYDDSEEFKRLSTFNIEELGASVPYRRLCEWRYESCANPCVKTCSDPEGIACKFLPPVEGCLPYCPKNMILDEVTLKCVYPEDCIPVTPTESAIGTKPSLLISHTGATTERFPQTPPLFVTSGTESTRTGVTAKITMKANTTLMGMNMSAQSLTDFHSLEASNAATYSTFSLPSTVEPSDVLHSTASPTVLSKLISSTDFPTALQASAVTSRKQSSSVSSSEEDGKISAISAGIITQSTTPMITNTTVKATSLKAPYIFAKIPPSSSASLLVASGTTVASRITTKTTDSFVADLEFYMASASVPTTTETLMHVSHKSLFTSAASQTSQSTTETPQMMIMKTTGTTSPLSQMKSTSFTASEFKYATSFERTVAILESGQTSHEQRNVTKTKSTTTEKSSLPYLTVSAVQSSPFSRNTTSEKNLFLSGVPDVTSSNWSKISTQKTIKPYFSLTEPTELQTRTITDLFHSSGGMALPSSSEPVETQTSLASTETMTAIADKASFGTMMHTLMSTSSECVPRYLEPVDKCSQYVCVNAGWMLYNLSRNCPKDVRKPDCGFRGMPVQVNTDSCCPEWECPCQCSVLSELSVITFDGNNIALCNMASYILVKLPGETIVAHIEKCPANQSANSIRKLVPPASTSGLCFKKLNVTTRTYKLLINRLARKVVVDSVIQSLPFSKEGLSIQDTGAMYVINSPAGISIKWAHVTGIIDIQYGLHSNTSMKTEGLCGVCNGDPTDDLKMQNKTIITNMEEIEVFIKSWEIEKSLDVTTRRPVRNCTEDNCTYCMELLNRSIFIPCHKKVSPQEFCEKMWINSTYFWNYECDALSAYVALCNKHNICIKWRTPDYCSLSCPEGKEYQPCVQPCEAKTCLNKWFYEDSPCSYLREDCVCKNGTILHRTDSDLCIPEEKCTCTDNKGQPRSAGEIWNGSMRGCCMYNCLENGSIVAVEPECNEDPPPVCEREGEVIIHVIEERACCPKKVCECNMSLCDAIIPTCKPNEKLVVGYHPLSCCPQYRCECDPSVCFNASQLDCREDQFIVEAKQENPCCFSYLCVCESCIEPVPLCNEGEILTVDLNTIHYCCPHYYCVCDENLCPEPPMNCTDDMTLVKEKIPGQCCPEWHCECSCENTTMLTCKLGEVKKIDGVSSACGCTHYICEKDDVCIFQEVTVLNPGQSVIQYLDGDLCYTVQCLQEKDQNTGYNAMHFTMVNCSQQCEAHQIYIPSSSHHTCCGTCQNVSCSFHTENGTLIVYEEGSTWSSNCTNYKCAKTAAGAMILGSSVVCPPFNDTECTKNGGIVQAYNDGCCKTCSGLGVLPFAISPVVPTDSINCEPGKKEERICQKMTIRTTIRKNDCISQSPINVASCDGKCPSATIFNVNIDSHLRFCKCCRENGTRNLTVPLRCSGNGTEIMYVIQEPIDCSCQWN